MIDQSTARGPVSSPTGVDFVATAIYVETFSLQISCYFTNRLTLFAKDTEKRDETGHHELGKYSCSKMYY